VNLSVAIIPMSHQFGWNSTTAGLVQSSFFWGYALSQLPGGWLAKIFGGRLVTSCYPCSFFAILLFAYQKIYLVSTLLSICRRENKRKIEMKFSISLN